MAHPATNPTAADLDAAEARLRTLEARRATAGASCSSSDKAAREKALRLNAKIKRQIAQAKAERERLKAALRADAAAQASGRAGTEKAVDWPTATQAFLNDVRDRLAWVADRDRWTVWNGRCWAFDAKGANAALVAQRWVRDCAEANGQPALRSRARAHHELLDHAKGPLLRAFRTFDSARVAHLLTVANGTIDLRTGELLPHDPADLITRELPVAFDPDAAGEFPARLLEIFQGDAELADWFRREIGMAATGFDQAKRVYFLCGDLERPDANGDNGKSLVVDTIRAALGSYVGGIKSALLCRPSFDRDAHSHDAGRQGLIGSRLALGAEFPTGSRLNDAEFNELSGGEPIRARMPNQPDETEFLAQATIIISANTVPALGTTNRSTRERLTSVPFFARFHKPGEPVPVGGLVADYGLNRLLKKARFSADVWFQVVWRPASEVRGGLSGAVVGAVRGPVRFVFSCRGSCEQLGYSEQVVGGGREGEDSFGPCAPPDLHLIIAGLRLDPAEDLLDALADALADGVAGVARGAPVDGGFAPLAGLADRAVDGEVRRDLARSQIADELRHVISLIRAEGDAAGAPAPVEHHQGRLPLRRAGGLGECCIDHQPVAVLHQGMAHEAQAAALAIALAVEPGVGVGGGGVGRVGALLARGSCARRCVPAQAARPSRPSDGSSSSRPRRRSACRRP